VRSADASPWGCTRWSIEGKSVVLANAALIWNLLEPRFSGTRDCHEVSLEEVGAAKIREPSTTTDECGSRASAASPRRRPWNLY